MSLQPHKFEQIVQRRACCDYWLYLPPGYEARNEPWPLVLYLHGRGERGDLEKAKKHGPPKRIAAGEHFPFILLAPSCAEGRWWEPQLLEPLVSEVVAAYRVDEDRIYGTGLSMGGFGTWSMAIHCPDLFAAIVPICGGGVPYLVDRIAHLPVWAFHGQCDSVVPLYESQRMIDALRAVGNDARLTVVPDSPHDVWTHAYSLPELYDWLLSHRRRRGG